MLNADHYGLEKVKERIVEYLAVQARSQKLQGPDPLPRRPSRRGQDLARQVGGAGHGARVHPHLARRRPGRVGDPRPPADLHRLHARQDHPGAEEGQDHQPAHPARRDRQDGPGLPRRPGLGDARGARPGAELDLRRPLPRGGVRPVERDVHHDGQLVQHAGAAPRPDGDHLARRLHRGREARDRQAAPAAQGDEEPRPEGRASSSCPTTRCNEMVRTYTREAGVRNLEREIAKVAPQGGDASSSRRRPTRSSSPPRTSTTSWASRSSATASPRRRTRSASSRARLDAASAGDLLSIEALRLPGKGRMKTTGKLGDVMKESIEAASSYVRSHRAADRGQAAEVRQDGHPRPRAGRARRPRTAPRPASRW